MFNFPTNIGVPGFRVGLPDDETDPNDPPGFRVGLTPDGTGQDSPPGLVLVGQPIQGLDQNGLSGFRYGPPDKAPDRNATTEAINGTTKAIASAVGGQAGALVGGPPGRFSDPFWPTSRLTSPRHPKPRRRCAKGPRISAT